MNYLLYFLIVHTEMSSTTAEGLAYDWLNKKLYWSDASVNSIVGMFTNGTGRKVVASVVSPRAIAVNPCRGFVCFM